MFFLKTNENTSKNNKPFIEKSTTSSTSSSSPTTPNNNANKSAIFLNSIAGARNSIIRGKELYERGRLGDAEKLIVSGFKTLIQNIDYESSHFIYPTQSLGMVSMKMGKYQSGEKFFKIAQDKIQRAMQENNFYIKNESEVYNNQGLLALRKGNTTVALQFLTKALETAEKHSLPTVPSIYSNFGEYYKLQLKYEQSLNYFSLAHLSYIHIYGSSTLANQDTIDKARCLLNRAQILRILERYDEGKEFLIEGFKVLSTIFRYEGKGACPKSSDWAKALIEFGHFYAISGEYEKAKQKFINAKEIYESLETPFAPDYIINNLNLAILERYLLSMSTTISPTTLIPSESKTKEYIVGLLKPISKPLEEMKSQTCINLKAPNRMFVEYEKLCSYLKYNNNDSGKQQLSLPIPSPSSWDSNNINIEQQQQQQHQNTQQQYFSFINNNTIKYLKLIEPHFFQLTI
eukprot:gene4343-5435_t